MTKKKILKSVLSLTLALALTLGALPFAGMGNLSLTSLGSITANAAEEIEWTVATKDMLKLSPDGTTITGYYADKLSGNIEIPDKIDGTAITSIAQSAFEGCEELTAVKIPETITSIGNGAFNNCANLKTVYFNANNCGVLGSASTTAVFANCNNLTKFVFGEKVTAIPYAVCTYATNLKTVEFKADVTSIGGYAFDNCSSLTGVDLSTVKTIGECAFKNCKSIENFTFSKDLETIGWEAFDGCIMTEITIPEKVTSIGNRAFNNCANLKTVYFNANNCGVLGAANTTAVFANCNNLTKFVFGEKVTAIPYAVCAYATNLKTVEFNGIVKKIGDNAFFNCSSIETVNYAGTEKDKAKIVFGKNNDYLINATWTCKEEEKPVEPDTPAKPEIPELIDAKSITINYKGSVSIGKADLKNIDVTYESSAPEIISVDENGTITAVGTGTATITATATVDGEVIKDEVTVTSAYTWWQWIVVIILFGWIWY